MVFFIYLVMNGLGLLFFIKKKKNLHILEILAYWFLASYLTQNFSALCFMNFKTLIIPDKPSLEFSHFLNRTTLIPLIMVLFLDEYLTKNSLFKIAQLMVIFVGILTGIEWLSHYSGVLVHYHWQFWWSPANWFGGLLLLIGFMNIFRRILFRGADRK